MATRIGATALSYDLSDVSNRVLYREKSFIIERSGRPVACLEPVGPRRGATLQEVIDLIEDLEVPEGFAAAVEGLRAAHGNLEKPGPSR